MNKKFPLQYPLIETNSYHINLSNFLLIHIFNNKNNYFISIINTINLIKKTFKSFLNNNQIHHKKLLIIDHNLLKKYSMLLKLIITKGNIQIRWRFLPLRTTILLPDTLLPIIKLPLIFLNSTLKTNKNIIIYQHFLIIKFLISNLLPKVNLVLKIH